MPGRMWCAVAGNFCRAIRSSSCKSRSRSRCLPLRHCSFAVQAKPRPIDTGLKPGASYLLEVDASLAGYEPKRAQELYHNLSERLAALPGVEHASISSNVPFGMIQLSRKVQRAGIRPGPDAKPATAAEGLAFKAAWNSVGADYFSTVGLPVSVVARSPKRKQPSPVRRWR